MFLNEVGKQMTASSSEQSSQNRHKRKGKKKKHSTDNSNVLETPPPPQRHPPQQPTQHRPSKQLEFNQAMEDFSHMFPRLDREVIESVLRSNNGAVDITIDQLLVLDQGTDDFEDPANGRPSPNQIFPPSPFSAEQPPLFGEDKPPPYSPPSPNSPFSKFHTELSLPPVTEQRQDTHQVQGDIQDPFSLSAYPPPLPQRRKQYHPALLGPLPDDFLRIPSPPARQPQNHSPQQMVSSDLQERLVENRRQQVNVRKNDKKSQQRLEDERIALLLQNEVFLEELRRHPEFISSLDRDYRNAVQAGLNTDSESLGAVGGASGGPPGIAAALVDNEDVRNKLPHMGKTTKTKLSAIAKKFNKKKRKSSKVNSPEPNLTHHSGPPPAMAPSRRLNDNTKRQAAENTYASLSPTGISPYGR